MESFFNDPAKMEVKRNVNIVFNTFSEFTKNYPTNQSIPSSKCVLLVKILW